MGLVFCRFPLYSNDSIDEPVTFTYWAILWVIFWEWICRRKISTTSAVPTLMQFTLQYLCSQFATWRNQIYTSLHFTHVNSVLIPR